MYEYAIVRVGILDVETAIEAKAKDGWRLHTIADIGPADTYDFMLVFEREQRGLSY